MDEELFEEVKRPCEEAYLGRAYEKYGGQYWEYPAWYIDINTLEELNKLIAEEEKIIIRCDPELSDHNHNPISVITIYDQLVE